MNPQLNSTQPVISAEHAVECAVAGAVWQADIITIAHTLTDHTLRADTCLLRLTPGPKEQWRFWFAHCAAHQVLPIGAPGNKRLIRLVRQSAFAQPSVLYEIVDSEWLKTCQPVGGAPGDLHHYVIVDDEQNLALHVAATTVIGQRLEARAALEGTEERLERVAAPVSLTA